MDLTVGDTENSPEVSVVTPGKIFSHLSRTKELQLPAHPEEERLFNLSRLFDRSLQVELITEDLWMDRLRTEMKRNDRHGFELMGPYTNKLYRQMAVLNHCILEGNRLAVLDQLRSTVMKQIHLGHP